MTEIKKISYSDFEFMVDELAFQIQKTGRLYDAVYGLPRGGVPLAIALAAKLNLPLSRDAHDDERYILICDDLVDSGATIKRLNGDGCDVAVLIKKPGSSVQPEFSAKEMDGWIEFPWETEVEAPAEDAIRRILQYLGEDVNRDGLKDTPKRVIKSYREIFGGYAMDEKKILSRQFESELPVEEVIISKDIPFTSTCEHHMLPFVGVAHVGYIPGPGGKIVGLSKLARVVDCFSLRLQNQERITQQVAKAIEDVLGAQAVGVVVESAHSCMSCRGVKKTGSTMVTSCMKGLFKQDRESRNEFYRLVGKR